jgi:hypothetical protein
MFPSVEAISISIEIHSHVVALDKNIFMLRIAAKTRLILVRNPIGIQILGVPVLGLADHEYSSRQESKE